MCKMGRCGVFYSMKMNSRLLLALALTGMVVLCMALLPPLVASKRHAQRMHSVNSISAPYPPLIITLTNNPQR